MNEYLLLNLAVVGILAGSALITIAVILMLRLVDLIHRANRRIATADRKNLAAHRMYWAALDAARRQGVRR